MNCSNCGTENPQSHKFCSECGTPLAQTHQEAERRTITVMFCDLAGSTALSERFDPEDLQDILVAYQDCCRKQISQYDGYIARYMGDGILIYFGYPTAHENDAARAAMAALSIVDAVPNLSIFPDCQLAVRIGIATGDVVVGDIVGHGAAEERAVLGVTPNLAARLQGVADENQIIVSETTRQLLGDSFTTHDLGTFPLKGITEPTRAWRIDSSATTPDKTTESDTPFVGRTDALMQLDAAMNSASTGQLTTSHLVGSPGIGKTRLIAEFLSRHSHITTLVWNCSAFHVNTPLHPVPAEFMETTAPVPETGEAQRQAVFEAITSHLIRSVSSAPALLVIDDVHWIDPTTADLLHSFKRSLKGQPLMILISGRPGEAVDRLHNVLGGALIELAALNNAEAETLVLAMTGDAMQAAQCRNIIDRAGGLPLFLEELTRVMSDGETENVPVSLQESLLARLDSLGPVKRMAQLASVIGRTFSSDDLSALSEIDEPTAASDIDALISAGMLVQEAGHYSFRHALIHEVAYSTLLRSTRRRVHGEIAEHLKTTVDNAAPELIAHHLSEAEHHVEAAPYWIEAAKRSAGIWAHVEAAAYYSHALQHAVDIADPAWEVAARFGLIESLRILDRSEDALSQLNLIEALLPASGSDPDWFHLHVLRGNILFPMDEAEKCIASHEAAHAVAKNMADPEAEARALSGIGDAHWVSGHVQSAERAFDACVTIAEAHRIDPVTLANICLRGHMRIHLCRLEDAIADCRKGVSMAFETGNRRAEVIGRGSCLGRALMEAGDFTESIRSFDEAIRIAVNLGSIRYQAVNLVFKGKIALTQGLRADSLDLGNQAVAIAREDGPRFCLPMAIGVVACAEETPEACRDALDEADALIAEGCLAHNPLWYYRDTAIACIHHGWLDQAKHYGQKLRDTFSTEPFPWIDLVADGIDALVTAHENGSHDELENAIRKTGDLGFLNWKRTLENNSPTP